MRRNQTLRLSRFLGNTQTSRTRRNGARRGVVIVYVALCLVVFMGMAGIAVDVSMLYQKRAKAQRAADAAALAGAIQLADGKTKAQADTAANSVAVANGYNTSGNATLVSTYPAYNDTTARMDPSWYQVRLARTEPLFFMAVLGFRNIAVGAPATALFQQPGSISIVPVGQQYGANGNMMLSVFGPYANKEWGDAYSTLYHDPVTAAYVPGATDGAANSDYNPNGYDFLIQIPNNYASLNGTNQVMVELFDPDSYNAGGTTSPNGTTRVDEIWTSTHGGISDTTTQYSLYYTNDTAITTDDILLGTTSYGNTSATDMKWVSPTGFTFDITDSRWGTNEFDANAFRVNVKTTNGSSENGFNLRAGPVHAATMTQAQWTSAYQNNGTTIKAQGKMNINFMTNTTVQISLGYVPAGATSVTIDRFDTDVGSTSVTYNDGSTTRTGVLTANGQHLPDTYTLPANYPGGTWTASYAAGTQDTSSWSMYYSGPPTTQPGHVRLIR
jgi:Flp pilus assembly protein TadG